MDDDVVGVKVYASFKAGDRTYGARRVWRDVLADGISCEGRTSAAVSLNRWSTYT